MKLILKYAIIVFALAAAVLFSKTAFAEEADNGEPPVSIDGNIRFTGEAEPFEYANYYVDGITEIKDGESFSFPKTTVLTVKNGAELRIYVGSEIDIKGTLIIEQGARVTVSGVFKAYESSKTECLGEFAATKKSTVMLAGEFFNSQTAVFSGKTLLYKSGVFNCDGKTVFSHGSSSDISGKMNVSENGRLLVKGEFDTTLNAEVAVEGYVYLSGRYYNTGALVLKEGAVDMLSDGQFVKGKSGRVYDERKEDERADEDTGEKNSFGSGKLLRGIDVSYWQGAIDWEKVKAAGIDFTFMRASLGDYYIDETLDYNITEAQRAGIKVGVYHYLKADTVEASRAEAKFFLDAIKQYEFDFPIVVDVEDTNHNKLSVEELTRVTEVFCEEIKKAGYTPMIYSSTSWLLNKLDTESLSKNYEIWVAHWGTVKPGYRGSYGVWQYSCKGKVSGISGSVDLNVAYVDYSKKE